MKPTLHQDLAARICRDVAELPDRNSPEDWPEAMLVTQAELERIVVEALQSASVPAGAVADYLSKFMGKGNGIVRRFYNGEEQSVVDAGDWMLEANQLLQALSAPSPAPPLRVTCNWEGSWKPPMTQAASDVLAERQRQINAEGWTPAHDDEHIHGDMAAAAACYAVAPGPSQPMPVDWPWEVNWWKPKDWRSNLVRSGALILAEIERLDRTAGIGVKGADHA